MSKIGRKPILLNSVKVEIKDNVISLSATKGKITHVLPASLNIKHEKGTLILGVNGKMDKDAKMNWGLHRALLANEIKGIDTGFEENIKIVGLGFKAQITGKKMIFSLGYSHKIDFEIPVGVEITVDKTGQLLNVKAGDKRLLGQTCDTIRSFRPVEPYKGTGIIRENEFVIRKAGKSKTAA
ncbi:TPA: 50S ribosomal protein L6 [Candidatus Dependentiae bacterium]|nr:MAG: 50S ribosomal protein L6 [candidate division TM6 bacterium GW2011_GWE2_31_21]KKP53112.1 MAG: 50S ribosomal protein L6 [candidate division TM6 bacterium GW2011_GWF2_33_332]HBS47931.1 50S ribosomal protein L6 [Candidatus Dependentiae bacterium]HBZ73465.1 50S ribosomal protein L6 [Candidatus Dependentiae bacterium]